MTTLPVATVHVYDATHEGIGALPAGRAAGYTTGTGIVPWTAADWAAHPGAVRICQDPGATDTTADVLDVEAGAATIGDCPAWYRAAAINWATGTRPGQRHPAIYCSLTNVTPLVNTLIADGITSGPCLWIANWNLTQAEATALVATGGGPFPVIGVQYGNRGAYDESVFSVPWLGATSTHPAADPPAASQTPQEGYVTYTGQISPGAKTGVPVVKGTTNRLCLYADMVDPANPLSVRVAVLSEAKGYSQITTVSLGDSRPHYVLFTETDVAAVSFQREDTDPARDVGYFITG